MQMDLPGFVLIAAVTPLRRTLWRTGIMDMCLV